MVQVTQSEIARQLGVSQRAVGYALSAHPTSHQKLATETRQRILQTAHRLGYVPHHAARRLARSRTTSRTPSFEQIGVIYLVSGHDDVLDPICLAMMSGAERELYRLHAFVTFVRVQEPNDWEKVDLLVRAGSVDGWLLYGGSANDAAIARLKLPCVILGDHHCTQPIFGVNVDNVAVGRLAAQHLASLGHRDIGVVGSGLDYVYQQEIRAGFRRRANELGLNLQEPTLKWSYANGKPIADWYLNARPKPTALFTPESDWAEPVRRVLNQAHIEVPQDVSVIGCEPRSQAAESQDFTRIELPMIELGRQGAALLKRAATEPGIDPTELKTSPALIEGWSTCPPRARTASQISV